MTKIEFYKAYEDGERYFTSLDFEYLDGFTNKDFSNIIFENCFLYLDFRGSDLTNAQFLNCNIKEIDLRNTNLTGALIKNCLTESAMFKDAIVRDFKFIDNYYYGLTIGQKEFDEMLRNQGEFEK